MSGRLFGQPQGGGISAYTAGTGITFAGNAIAVDTTASLTFTAAQTVRVAGVETNQTVGFTLANPDAAGAGSQKFSPVLELSGYGWKTDATAGTVAVRAGWQVRPVQGAAAPTGFIDLLWSIGAAAYGAVVSVGSDGFVGMGTQAPRQRLHLHSSAADGNAIIQFTNAATGSAGTDGTRIGWFGAAGDFRVDVQENAQFLISTNGQNRWVFLAGGDLEPYADIASDLGAANKRVAIVYAQRVTESYASVGTAQTVGVSLTNPTAAAAGTQQYSPVLELCGQGWQTDTAASQSVAFGWQTRPIQGASAPTGALDLLYAVNGGAYGATPILSISSIGSVTIPGQLTVDTRIDSVGGILARTNVEFIESASPGVADATHGFIYLDNNGAGGKQRFVAQFDSGAAVAFALEV